jgi:hypothetical protein
VPAPTLAVVVAGVGDDDLERLRRWGLLDEQAVRLAAGDLVEASEGGVGGHAFEERVLAAEVPVAHPGARKSPTLPL